MLLFTKKDVDTCIYDLQEAIGSDNVTGRAWRCRGSEGGRFRLTKNAEPEFGVRRPVMVSCVGRLIPTSEGTQIDLRFRYGIGILSQFLKFYLITAAIIYFHAAVISQLELGLKGALMIAGIAAVPALIISFFTSLGSFAGEELQKELAYFVQYVLETEDP